MPGIFALRGRYGKRSFQKEEAELTHCIHFLGSLNVPFSHENVSFPCRRWFQSREEARVCEQSLNVKGGEGSHGVVRQRILGLWWCNSQLLTLGAVTNRGDAQTRVSLSTGGPKNSIKRRLSAGRLGS